jgi:predicted DNA-binding transcriptional regulator AlpA
MTLQNETLFYKMKDLCELIPASRSTVNRLVRDGVLPAPHHLTKRLVVWKKADIDKWSAQFLAHTFSSNKYLIESKKSLKISQVDSSESFT